MGNYDGWVLNLRGEFGEYEDADWSRVEVEGKATTVHELEEVLQRYVKSIGFDYLNVVLETKGE